MTPDGTSTSPPGASEPDAPAAAPPPPIATAPEPAATRSSLGSLVAALRDGSASERALRLALLVVRLGPAVALLAAILAMALLTPLFLTERNMTNLGLQSAVVIALALGQLLVVLTGGIDISVGSVIGLTSAAAALLYGDGWAGLTIVVAVLLIGCAVGSVNGILFVKGRLPHPLVATLATLGIVRGVAFLTTDGEILTGQAPLVEELGAGLVGSVPVPTIVVAVLAFLTWVLLRRMKWGRWVYAIGGNPEAAKRSGIPVDRVLISVYLLCGLAAAVAGLIVAGRTGVGDANAGELALFDAVTAVLIGGVAVLGGRGSVSNALVGAMTVAVIQNGLNLLGVTAFWELIAVGTMLILAVELNMFRGYLEGRFRVMQTAAHAR
jgi:ribose transport system permease protein